MEKLNIFEFGTNDKGEYVNLVEESNREREEKFKTYPYEEIIKGHEDEADFCVVATFHMGCVSQWGMSVEDIQREIQREVDTKCYHYGNMEKGIYAYTYKIEFEDGEVMYWFCVENEKHIVVVKHLKSLDDLLNGNEKICYPACEVYMFDSNGSQIRNGYGHYKDDIRYKVLCEEFEILEFSTNRIDPKKPPKDFYEAEYTLPDFIKHWGEGKNE